MACLLISVPSGKIIDAQVVEIPPGHSVWARTQLVLLYADFYVVRVSENVGVLPTSSQSC